MPGEKYFRKSVMGYMKEDVLAYIEQQNNALEDMRLALDASEKAAADAESDRQRKIKELLQSKESLAEDLERERLAAKSLEAEISGAQGRCRALEEELKKAETNLFQKDADIKDIKEKYLAEISVLKSDCDRETFLLRQNASEQELLYKQQMEAQKQEYNSRINSLTDEIISVRADLNRARGQLDDMNKKHETAADAMERLCELNKTLNENSSRLLGAGDKTADAVEQLADALSALSNAVKAVGENAGAIRELPLSAW